MAPTSGAKQVPFNSQWFQQHQPEGLHTQEPIQPDNSWVEHIGKQPDPPNPFAFTNVRYISPLEDAVVTATARIINSWIRRGARGNYELARLVDFSHDSPFIVLVTRVAEDIERGDRSSLSAAGESLRCRCRYATQAWLESISIARASFELCQSKYGDLDKRTATEHLLEVVKLNLEKHIVEVPMEDDVNVIERLSGSVLDPKLECFGGLKSLVESDLSVDFLIDGLWQAGMVGAIAGVSKSLKTRISINLMLSLLTGQPFLGIEKFKVMRKLERITYFCGETEKLQFALAIKAEAKRMQLLESEIDDVISRICMHPWVPTGGDTGLDRDLRSVVAHRAKESDMIIYDSLYRMIDGDSAGNASREVVEVNRFVELVRSRNPKCTVVFNDHGTKAAGETRFTPKPMSLQEIAGASKDKYYRQWLMVNRVRDAVGENGRLEHSLWFQLFGGQVYVLQCTENLRDLYIPSYSLVTRAEYELDKKEQKQQRAMVQEQSREELMQQEGQALQRKILETFTPGEEMTKGAVINKLDLGSKRQVTMWPWVESVLKQTEAKVGKHPKYYLPEKV